MVKNIKFAFIFRCFGAVMTLLSIFVNLGVFTGNADWLGLRFYTLQSNILVLAMFILLAVKTGRVMVKGDDKNGVGYYPRLSAGCLLCIMLTFCVFWAMIAPTYENPTKLLQFSNNGVHLLVPLLMLADYIMFSVGGKLTKLDPFYFAIVPVAYLLFATIIGFAGTTYITGDGVTRHFPYFFMDYINTGWMCAVYIIVLTAFYIGAGFLIYYLDTKRNKVY